MFRVALCLAVFLFAPPVTAQGEKAKAANATVTALRFAHQFAKPAALTPSNDRAVKTRMTVAAEKRELTWDAAGDLFDGETFRALAGDATAIPLDMMEKWVAQTTPASRADLNDKVRQHADLLCTQFDMIEEAHRKPAEELAAWVAKNYKPGRPLAVGVICTRNTRRSVLGATTGRVAAAYYGLPEVKFFSGGTDPEAVNPRTVATLKDIGIDIEPTGKEATRGKADSPNPKYHLTWGKGLECEEFSKKYTDAANPGEKFAAVLVCSDADAACPKVDGADLRLAVPYLDPKAFDDAPFESAKYAERRDDEGRFMLCVLMQARRRLEAEGRLK